MGNNDRNKNNPSNASDENTKRDNRPDEGDVRPDPVADEGVLDLDGDGFIGNTGGFYGGTSYVGSNYGPDWNAEGNNDNQNEGNYGAAGQPVDSPDEENEGDEEDRE